MPDFSLDMSVGYTWIKKQTPHDLWELLPLVFEDTQKRNPTAAMEFLGGVASRAVKYNGFAAPPSRISQAKLGERKHMKMRAAAGLHVVTTSTDAH